MAGLLDFLQELLLPPPTPGSPVPAEGWLGGNPGARHGLGGRAVLRTRPHRGTARERSEASAFLANVQVNVRLAVAGPLIPFHEGAALAAAERVWWACWFLVNRNEPNEEVEGALPLLALPNSASEHLSADLTLRFLVGVHGRARGLAPDDRLTRCVEGILRQYPLSGVLSSIGEPPTTPLDFGGHPGLLLLYAERLADHYRPTWGADASPTADCSPVRDYLDLVLGERGLPTTPRRTES